ncbi:MAG TPA: hypothetical protein VJT81_13485, partial [Burkholderiales bacterium]|nr:hypothetical protein [Burkholderiales bacterium]
TISPGDVIKMRADGANLIAMYQNDVLRCSITEAFGATNTKHGLRSHNRSDIRYDNFTIAAI